MRRWAAPWRAKLGQATGGRLRFRDPVAREAGPTLIPLKLQPGLVAAPLEKAGSLPTSCKLLVLFFFLTLPLVNPWVRGDGVGYYAYVRSYLVEHRLDFTEDWRAGNESFVMGRIDRNGNIDRTQYTKTGQLDNHWTVGPAILWAPFLVPVHYALLVANHLGTNVRPDGFSKPYILTMSVATALYGFLGLYFSFLVASQYVGERWSGLATFGIWFGSSLPVYMYFNPSWAHAHSVFAVGIFLWYWQRTRRGRTLFQWMVLGLISGLMLDVYYPNVAILLVPALESLRRYWKGLRAVPRDWESVRRLLLHNAGYILVTMVAFLPTMVTRRIIYGGALSFGYGTPGGWRWTSPVLWQVLFSSDHGLISWTPIVLVALIGLAIFWKYDAEFAAYITLSSLVFYYLISSYFAWDGVSSFGARYFLSLTPVFVLGLSVLFYELQQWLKSTAWATMAGASATAVLVVWNLAFIFQWGTRMVPARGPISWKQMVRNQFTAVPQQAATEVAAYFEDRRALMRHIEQDDVRQLRQQQGVAKTK